MKEIDTNTAYEKEMIKSGGGRPWRIAMQYPWPGSIENGEFEIIRRLQYYFRENGISFELISNDGQLLDDNSNPIGQKLAIDEKYDFVISAHYSSYKSIDAFHYHALWNPTEFLFHEFNNPIGFRKAVENIFSCDDFLQSNSATVIERLRGIATQHGHEFANDFPFLFPSSPDYGFKTNITEDFKIFYCGINWDAHNEFVPEHGWNRFNDMFKELDEEGVMGFYGPRLVRGREPWGGFENYMGEVPFDGISLIRTINEAGVGLALASEAHQESGGLLSSRVYETLAAGALLISTRNEFLENLFGDSVLYIDYDARHPKKMAHQIRQHAQWISRNLPEARSKAKHAQQIWREKLAFDVTIPQLLAAHGDRVTRRRAFSQAREPGDAIDVIAYFRPETRWSDLHRILEAFDAQDYEHKRLLIVCDTDQKIQVAARVASERRQSSPVTIIETPYFRKTARGIEPVPTGALVTSAFEELKAPYVAFLSPGVRWHHEQLSTLKRVLEDDDKIDVAYGQTLKIVKPILVHGVLDRPIEGPVTVRRMGDFAFRGNGLYRRSALDAVPAWLLAQVNYRHELILLTLALAQGRGRACPRAMTSILAGADGFYHQFDTETISREREILTFLLEESADLAWRDVLPDPPVLDAPPPMLEQPVHQPLPVLLSSDEPINFLVDALGVESLEMKRPLGLQGRLLLRRARTAARGNDWSEASKLYADLIRKFGGTSQLWAQLGHALKNQDNFSSALHCYSIALKIDPDAGELRQHRQYVANQLGAG